MKQWASRGRPICCGNLHFMDDNTRTGYTYPSPLVAPCPCVVCHQNVLFLFFFFFFFFLTRGTIWRVSIMVFRLPRRMPRGLSQLVMLLQMPIYIAYKQQNSPLALYISKNFFLDICHLEPRLEVLLRLQSSSIQSQVFSSFSSLGFPLSFLQDV